MLTKIEEADDTNTYLTSLPAIRRKLKEIGVIFDEEDLACPMLTHLPVSLTKDHGLSFNEIERAIYKSEMVSQI